VKSSPDEYVTIVTTVWQRILLVVFLSYIKKKKERKDMIEKLELQTTPLLGVLIYFLGYEPALLLSLCLFLLTSNILINHRK